MYTHAQCGKCGAKAADKHKPNCNGRKVIVTVYGRADFELARSKAFDACPKIIRVYDNGGIDAGGTVDRYTIVRTTPAGFFCDGGARNQWYPVFFDISASAQPFHPQGVGMTSETTHRPLWNAGKWGGDQGRPDQYKPARWKDLPQDVRQCAWQLAFDDNEP